MGLLDRFKPQPRWKHADASIRVSAVQDLPEEEQDLLAAIAREDDDARVRRAAVSKLGNVAVLADVVRHESDPEVRDEAAGVLVDIALGAYGADEAASLAALEGLGGLPPADAQKQLVLVAKTGRSEAVCLRALDLVGEDPRALGTVARRSEQAAVRLAALQRLADADEVVATALRAEHKDVALAALERVSSRETLAAIAARAKNPAAARRARAALRALEEEEAAAAEAEAKRQAAIEARRQAQRDVCRDVEALVSPADWHQAAMKLDQAEARWRAFGDEIEPDLARRFGDACAAAREALARHEAERAESEREARVRAELVGAREALIARVEAVDADAAETRIAELQAAWSDLPALADGAVAGLQGRFEAALREAEARRRGREQAARSIERLEALCGEAEALAGSSDFPAGRDARARWKRIRTSWDEAYPPVSGSPAAAAIAARFMQTEEQLKAKETEAREQRAREDRERRSRIERVAQSLERLAQQPEATLKALDHALRDAREARDQLEHVPPGPERDALLARLEQAQAPIVPRAQELREADDWQRWANAGVQEQLCARMEALKAVEDHGEVLKHMRELQDEWRNVAAGPRERGQALWRRFKAAQDELRAKLEPWMAEQSAKRTEHLQQKIALCERAEALADSTDWIATAEAIKGLQAEWKKVGPAARRDEQAAWERFRTACDRFFSRRHADLADRKRQWSDNLARKEALCAKAEALADSTDWDATAAAFKQLQAEWKTIGPVKKSRSEAIWQRFRGACDRFFDRYKHRHDVELAGRIEVRDGIVRDAEALAAVPADQAPSREDLLASLRELRARWHQAPALPREVLAPVAERLEAALRAVAGAHAERLKGSEFDVDTNTRALEDLCVRAEKLAGREAAPREAVSPASLLATQLREALAANTIGGRLDDDAKWRAAEHELRQLQAAWAQVGFVPDTAYRPLAQRFQRAAQRLQDRKGRGRDARSSERGVRS